MPPNAQGPVQVRGAVSSFGQGEFEHWGPLRMSGGSRGQVIVTADEGKALVWNLSVLSGRAADGLPSHRASAGQAELLLNGCSSIADSLKVCLKGDRPPSLPPLAIKRLPRTHSSPSLESPTIAPGLRKKKPIEIVGGISCASAVKGLLEDVVKGLEKGIAPVPATGGLGGAYYFKNQRGENVAIVKPSDEEPLAPNNPNGYVGRVLGQPGLKKAIRVGEAALREVAAYLLDHNNFANVPRTVLVKCKHPVFHVAPGGASRSKVGSFQEFKVHDFDCSEHGTSRFPPGAVHRIGILDVRLFNTDRHSGNILVRKLKSEEQQRRSSAGGLLNMDEAVELIPIDHGFCLPETLEAAYFEWLHWPQAALPFSEEELAYIAGLDAQKDVELLRRELPMLREASLRTLMLTTMVLQRAAAAGLTLAEIGGMLSRDCAGMDTEEASEVELVCMMARQQVEEEAAGVHTPRHSDCSSDEDDGVFVEQFQLELDGEDENVWTSSSPGGPQSPFPQKGPFSPCPRSPSPMSAQGRGFNPPLLRLEEEPSEGSLPSTPSSDASHCFSAVGFGKSAFSNRPGGISRAASLGHWKHQRPVFRVDPVEFKMGAGGQVVEAGAETGGPVVFEDMKERTWQRFLEVFSDLLDDLLATHVRESNKCIARLGTSCQF